MSRNFPELDVDDAARLLVGIPGISLSSVDVQVPGLVLLTGNRFSSSLLSLLTMNDTSCPVYNIGRRMMLTSNSMDHLSRRPLKVAYIWSLSSRSHAKYETCFLPNSENGSFLIKCTDVKPARGLFPQIPIRVFTTGPA